MPRLTNNRYLAVHTVLRRMWLEQKRLYSYLPAKQQWYLHHFYLPSESLSDQEMLEYRGTITAEDQAYQLSPAKPSRTST